MKANIFKKFAVGAAMFAVVMFGCGDDNGNGNSTGNENTHRLTIEVKPPAGGSVTRDPHLTSYEDGAVITLTARANDGYEFAGYSGDLTSTSNPFTFNITGNTTLTANFRAQGDNNDDPDNPIVTPPTGGSGTFTDSRDNQTYRYVTIGDQVWMAENLNYATTSGSWCYNNETSNCNTYGRLYDWATAMNISSSYNTTLWNGSDVNHRGVCPSGWHLPSDAEWTTLVNFVGGSSTAGTKLKSETDWSTEGPWGDYIPATDDFGFSALPGGRRNTGGSFGRVGDWGYWWTATEFGADLARHRDVYYYHEDVGSHWDGKGLGFSVRCVRD